MFKCLARLRFYHLAGDYGQACINLQHFGGTKHQGVLGAASCVLERESTTPDRLVPPQGTYKSGLVWTYTFSHPSSVLALLGASFLVLCQKKQGPESEHAICCVPLETKVALNFNVFRRYLALENGMRSNSLWVVS